MIGTGFICTTLAALLVCQDYLNLVKGLDRHVHPVLVSLSDEQLIPLLERLNPDQLSMLAFRRLEMGTLTVRLLPPLVKRGFDIDRRLLRGSPLIVEAIYRDDSALVKACLQLNCNVNAVNRYGWRPMDVAKLLSRADILNLLSNADAKHSPRNQAHLGRKIMGSFNNRIAFDEMLKNRGPDIEAYVDPRGESALSLAVRAGAEYPASKLAYVWPCAQPRNWLGQSAVHVAAQLDFWLPAFASFEYYMPLNELDGGAFSPLMHAARVGATRFIHKAVAAGADVNQQGTMGSALYISALYDQKNAARVLLKLGARPSKRVVEFARDFDHTGWLTGLLAE